MDQMLDAMLGAVLSAQAEVVRRRRRRRCKRSSSLRAGGGGPLDVFVLNNNAAFSPRRRRWSAEDGIYHRVMDVLSAQAEVVRRSDPLLPSGLSSLRAGGGGPVAGLAMMVVSVFSPRRRRWSVAVHLDLAMATVLSAQAEVVRRRPGGRTLRRRSLRAGGGGPYSVTSQQARALFSPRRRRWSVDPLGRREPGGVLSTQAEVVRTSGPTSAPRCSSLRAGGGGPSA